MGERYDNRPLGVFDSGLGGLTVVAALRRRLPDESIIYLGDTARVPYGTKSADTIVRFALEDARFLAEREVKAIVVACNTVSSLAMEALQRESAPTPVLGVVQAGVEATLAGGPTRRVVVLGTAATVASDSYRRLLHRADPGIAVRSVACPLLVPLVESGWLEGDIPERICRAYLEPVLAPVPDAVILGCTHYPLLKPRIQALLSEATRLVDSAEACAAAAVKFLRGKGLAAAPGCGGTARYHVTDMPSAFYELAARFLGDEVPNVDKVTLPGA